MRPTWPAPKAAVTVAQSASTRPCSAQAHVKITMFVVCVVSAFTMREHLFEERTGTRLQLWPLL